MTLRKLSIFLGGLLLIVTVMTGITAITYPIILDWLEGSARIVGKPIKTTVYANGQINKDFKVYHIDRHWDGEPTDYYILYFPYAKNSKLKVLGLNRKDNYVGIPVSGGKQGYDIIVGNLFQGEGGDRFISVEHDIKGFNFDPKLVFTDRQISFCIPPTVNDLKCDSLRVVLQSASGDNEK
jgi:hypothetical protein